MHSPDDTPTESLMNKQQAAIVACGMPNCRRRSSRAFRHRLCPRSWSWAGRPSPLRQAQGQALILRFAQGQAPLPKGEGTRSLGQVGAQDDAHGAKPLTFVKES